MVNGRARPGLEPSMVCVKNMLLGLNIIFVITGMMLVCIGSTVKGEYSTFDTLIGDDLISPASFLIATGVLIFIVALFGSVGAVRESTCLINMYTICLIVIFVFEISAGLAGFVMRTEVRGVVSGNFKNAIHNEYLADDGVKTAIDDIQGWLGCCGSDSPTDWEGVLNITQTQIDEIIVPDSCCGRWNETELASCDDPFTRGCLDIIANWLEVLASYLTAAAITMALIQAMSVYFSNELAKAIREAKSIRARRQMEIRHQLVNNHYRSMKEQPSNVVYLADMGDTVA